LWGEGLLFRGHFPLGWGLGAVLPESEVRVEVKFIGDCSSMLGTVITPSGKLLVKMTKMGKN